MPAASDYLLLPNGMLVPRQGPGGVSAGQDWRGPATIAADEDMRKRQQANWEKQLELWYQQQLAATKSQQEKELGEIQFGQKRTLQQDVLENRLQQQAMQTEGEYGLAGYQGKLQEARDRLLAGFESGRDERRYDFEAGKQAYGYEQEGRLKWEQALAEGLRTGKLQYSPAQKLQIQKFQDALVEVQNDRRFSPQQRMEAIGQIQDQLRSIWPMTVPEDQQPLTPEEEIARNYRVTPDGAKLWRQPNGDSIQLREDNSRVDTRKDALKQFIDLRKLTDENSKQLYDDKTARELIRAVYGDDSLPPAQENVPPRKPGTAESIGRWWYGDAAYDQPMEVPPGMPVPPGMEETVPAGQPRPSPITPGQRFSSAAGGWAPPAIIPPSEFEQKLPAGSVDPWAGVMSGSAGPPAMPPVPPPPPPQQSMREQPQPLPASRNELVDGAVYNHPTHGVVRYRNGRWEKL